MIAVQYPEPQFKIKQEQDKHFVFDAIRKVWLQLTEEEWVRQNFVAYLVQSLQYPSTVIALEKGLTIGELKKRFDILVYDKAHNPWLMVECKAPQVKLTEDVLQQVLRYNISIPVSYIVITNGQNTMAWKKESGSLVELTELPEWS